MNDLRIILKRNIMKMYLYCLSFKWTNYLKAGEREGMGIDDLRIPAWPRQVFDFQAADIFFSFVVLYYLIHCFSLYK